MPVQYPNFGNIPFVQPDYSGVVNFIPQALQAYNNPFAMRHERMMNEEKLKEQALKNALEQQYGPQTREAEIASKLAYAQMANMTPALKELSMAGIGPGSEDFTNIIKSRHGIPQEAFQADSNELAALGIPPSVLGTPLQGLPANEQNRAMQTMETGLTAAIEKTNALESLNTLDEIMSRSPHLWKSFQNILREPRDENELKKFIKTKALNEKDATDIDIFNKISNELALQAGMSLGNRNFTDAKLKALQMTKPDIKNTPAANKFVTQRLRHLFETGPAEQRAYQYGLKNRVRIIPNPEAFREFGKEESMPKSEPVRLGIPSPMQEENASIPLSDEEIMRSLGG